jgi:protein HIRA/HIR1
MRVADSRFVLSDFYSLLPSRTGSKKGEVLSRLEDAVRFGSIHSSWRPSSSRRGQQSRGLGGISASAMFDPTSDERQEDPVATMITRSHCEDRMACAVMLASASEYKRWLGMYARALAITGNADAIRLLADALLLGGEKGDTNDNDVDDSSGSAVAAPRSWWLSRSASILGLDRRSLVQSTVLPELRKNLALQRLANEISLELSA